MKIRQWKLLWLRFLAWLGWLLWCGSLVVGVGLTAAAELVLMLISQTFHLAAPREVRVSGWDLLLSELDEVDSMLCIFPSRTWFFPIYLYKGGYVAPPMPVTSPPRLIQGVVVPTGDK